MLWTWLAVVIAGIGGAGMCYALAALLASNSNMSSSLKRFAPFSAGACMLMAVIVGEYQWASHQISQLPQTAKVVTEVRPVSGFKPWTWFAPPVQRLSALDIALTEYAPIVLADVYLLAKWQAPLKTQQWFHCTKHQRANSAPQAAPPPEGAGAWSSLDRDDAYLQLACQSMRN